MKPINLQQLRAALKYCDGHSWAMQEVKEAAETLLRLATDESVVIVPRDPDKQMAYAMFSDDTKFPELIKIYQEKLKSAFSAAPPQTYWE